VVWVEIPAGCFMMGCSPGDQSCGDYENPPHEVTVGKFEMLETEVTEGQWAAVMPGVKVDGVQVALDPSCDYNGGGGANSPVECVNWKEAKAFCEAVDPKGRLCTEAEWEYAARGGTTTKYYCGDNASCLDGIAWYDPNSGGHKHDVSVKPGGKQPNAYGLYDMLGNVWEWVEDCWHADYDLDDDGDGDWTVGYPAWTAPPCDSGSYRVLRGGSFGNVDFGLRVSNRYYYDPSDVSHYLGLRCCRSE
jgi:formylglycine-generating enzyme required for sulfatase activity